MKPFSEDLRQRIVQVYEEAILSSEEVAARFRVSVGSVRRDVRQWREQGHLAAKGPGPGHPPKLGVEAQQGVIEVATNQVDASQDELRQAVKAHTGIEVSQPTICRLLQRAGITRKKNDVRRGTGHVGGEGRATSL